jgi:hypothetical protein
LLSPSSDGKPEAATAFVVASDDGHEDAQNMLSCWLIQLKDHKAPLTGLLTKNKLESL